MPQKSFKKMPGRLTVFQRTMLLWDSFHPYNAVHAARMEGRADCRRLGEIINSALEGLGLAGLSLDRAKRRFCYEGGTPGVKLRVVETDDLDACLSAEIEREINTPFLVDETFTPFRFFVAQAADSFAIGLVYCHFISDAELITAILKGIVSTYATGAAPSPERIDPYPHISARLALKMLKYAPLWILDFPGALLNIRKSSKPQYPRDADCSNGFSMYRVPAEGFRTALAAAREWGVTMNDLFLAAMVKAVTPVASGRMTGRRNGIAMSSIASIRRDLPEVFAAKMAPLLGSFSVFAPSPAGATLDELSAGVHRQTSKAKRHKLYLRTLLDLALALRCIPLYEPERREKFYRQNYPVWGGLSSLNLNPKRESAEECVIKDYYRGVSTGQMCPLVFSVTTYNDVLNVGVSFRNAIFSRETVDAIFEAFARCIAFPIEVA